jgi:dCTP diphosphatase
MDHASLIDELRAFVAERDWSQFHDPKNLAMLLASEAGELVAEYRWVRNDMADALSHEPEARQRIANEIGDVGIALMLLCDRTGIDLQTAMREKLVKNRRRYPVELAKARQPGRLADLMSTDRRVINQEGTGTLLEDWEYDFHLTARSNQ